MQLSWVLCVGSLRLHSGGQSPQGSTSKLAHVTVGSIKFLLDSVLYPLLAGGCSLFLTSDKISPWNAAYQSAPLLCGGSGEPRTHHALPSLAPPWGNSPHGSRLPSEQQARRARDSTSKTEVRLLSSNLRRDIPALLGGVKSKSPGPAHSQGNGYRDRCHWSHIAASYHREQSLDIRNSLENKNHLESQKSWKLRIF